MASNPMQRKARNSFLLGMVVMLLITGVIIGFLFMQLMNKNKKEKEEFAINLSTEELQRRTNKDALVSTSMLKPGAKEYENLEPGDKEALKHLVKVGKILENIHL